MTLINHHNALLPDARVIRAGALAGWHALVTDLGGDIHELTAAEGITPALLEDHDTMIPYSVFQGLIERSSVALGAADFGLRLGASQDITMLGPIGLLIANSPTLGQGLKLAQHFLSLHAPNEIWALVAMGDQFALRTLEVQRVSDRDLQSKELSLSSANAIIGMLGGDAARPSAVHFGHRPISSPQHYRQFFDAKPLFSQSFDELVYPRSALTLPIRKVNAKQLDIIEHRLREALTRQGSDTVRKTRWLLSQTQPASDLSIEHIASMLNMSTRSLQRHLQRQGLTFKQILRTSRCHAASRLLQSQQQSITEIAAAVGYLDSNAFSRAFKAVFGCGPRDFQKTLQGTHRQN